MRAVTIAEAKADLSELVERAARGETVRLTRRGKAVAKIAPLEEPRKPIDVRALHALTDRMPLQTEPSSEFVRHMRDEDRC